MIKHYIALNSLHLSTTILKDNKEYNLTFKGGRTKPTRRNGTFATDDPILQKAIENDNGYGKAFLLINNEEEPNVKKNENYQNIATIKSKRAAISWISEHLSFHLNKSTSTLEVIKFANQHGYTFPFLEKQQTRLNR